jgi:transmembrane sensor
MAGSAMNEDSVMNEPERAAATVPLSVMSEAAAWLVRLSGPLRTAAAEEGFQKWLKESTLHVSAFQRVSAEWDEADRLKRYTDVVIRVPGRKRTGKQSPSRRALLAAAAVTLLVTGTSLFYHLRAPHIATGINELRVITLDDGTKVHLNTATRITVAFDEAQRRVRLDEGEALFEVAKHSSWPFIVTAADRQVRALGTAFLVRREGDRIAVTLMSGKVAISPAESAVAESASSASAAAVEGPVMLAPGERITFSRSGRAPELDHPEVTRLLAWQQGKVAIDNLPLAAAVAEMNRYSTIQLVLEQPQADTLRISGVFQAGQSMSFARAVAQSYGLQVVDRGTSIVLTGVGRSAVE